MPKMLDHEVHWETLVRIMRLCGKIKPGTPGTEFPQAIKIRKSWEADGSVTKVDDGIYRIRRLGRRGSGGTCDRGEAQVTRRRGIAAPACRCFSGHRRLAAPRQPMKTRGQRSFSAPHATRARADALC